MKKERPNTVKAERPDQQSAADLAYDRITDLILTRDLRPGERTSVNLLADRLALGKTPIKEAITRLQTEGVLTVVGRSGTTIKAIGIVEARQLFALRRALEEFAVDAAVKHVTDKDVSKLRELLAVMRRTSSEKVDFVQSAAAFVRANVAFHATIVAAARNLYLDRLYSQIQLQAQIVTYLVHRGFDSNAARKRQSEHEAIVAALAARNKAALKKCLSVHASASETVILAALGAMSPTMDAAGTRARANGAVDQV